MTVSIQIYDNNTICMKSNVNKTEREGLNFRILKCITNVTAYYFLSRQSDVQKIKDGCESYKFKDRNKGQLNLCFPIKKAKTLLPSPKQSREIIFYFIKTLAFMGNGNKIYIFFEVINFYVT